MPFKKGQSGNPAGRKPSAARLELKTLLNKAWPLERRQRALSNLVTMAETDLEALKLLLAYTYGKPIERQEVSGPDGDEIPIQIIEFVKLSRERSEES